MFLDKLTKLLNDAFRPKPQYITVTPVTDAATAPQLPAGPQPGDCNQVPRVARVPRHLSSSAFSTLSTLPSASDSGT